jgi:hypothetical protein
MGFEQRRREGAKKELGNGKLADDLGSPDK